MSECENEWCENLVDPEKDGLLCEDCYKDALNSFK
ncbi:hypothetical protein EV579_0700 [Bacillus sp. BK450]|nr:hypothetical protein EV579_0700 [Bacillus sp. BK450]